MLEEDERVRECREGASRSEFGWEVEFVKSFLWLRQDGKWSKGGGEKRRAGRRRERCWSLKGNSKEQRDDELPLPSSLLTETLFRRKP